MGVDQVTPAPSVVASPVLPTVDVAAAAAAGVPAECEAVAVDAELRHTFGAGELWSRAGLGPVLVLVDGEWWPVVAPFGLDTGGRLRPVSVSPGVYGLKPASAGVAAGVVWCPA